MILLANGCSFVYGEELEENIRNQRSFAGVIANYFKFFEYHNISISGNSNYKILIDTMTWISKNIHLKDELFVLIGWTAPHRYYEINKNGKEYFLVTGDQKSEFNQTKIKKYPSILKKIPIVKEYIKYGLMDDLPCYKSTIGYIIGLQSFLKKYNIKYFMCESIIPIVSYQFQQNETQSLIDLQYYYYKSNLREYCLSNGITFTKNWNHPLEDGHELWANHLIQQIKERNYSFL